MNARLVLARTKMMMMMSADDDRDEVMDVLSFFK